MVDKAQLRYAIRKELAKVDYSEYCKIVHHDKWILGKHLKYICESVEKIVNREIKENILLLSMPPQHGKSQCVSETLPSWYLGNNPDNRVIELSYGDDLASKFGRRNRNKILEFGYDLFGIKLSKSSDKELEIEGHTGSLLSAGIMGGVTGNAAELIVVDDPIKNRKEAESQTFRDNVWDEYMDCVNTRLSATGVVIVIMTRWHEDDLIGRIRKYFPGRYLEINIPLEAEENDILGRSPGDALFPEIGKNNEWLKMFKAPYLNSKGLRSWNSLMQGKPISEDGEMFKDSWWNYYEACPRCPIYITTVDATFKDTSKSDFVAIEHWGKINNDYYLIDVLNKRMSFTETLAAIRLFDRKYPKTNGIYIEDKANGSAIVDVLKKDKSIASVIPYNPGKDSKESRASAITPIAETGHIHLPKFGAFLEDFKAQAKAFPKGANDDMVDAMSMAVNILRRKVAIVKEKIEYDPVYGNPFETEEEKMLNAVTGGNIRRMVKEMMNWGGV